MSNTVILSEDETCAICGSVIKAGDRAVESRDETTITCLECFESAEGGQ